MRMTRFVAGALIACAAVSAVPSAHAQMPESYREVQLRMLQLQRRMVLSMVDSMPENLYRDRVTPLQRDFAQQIQHVVGSFGFIFVSRLNLASQPTLPDTTSAFASRAGLRAYVNAGYDWAEGVLRAQSASQRDSVIQFFRIRIPVWQVWDEMHQHTIWTAGQVVANFRKHGMAPPGFGFF